MSRARAGKWIDGLFGDTPVVLAARATLPARLDALLHFLPRAARHADRDPELVHQLRVATRRAGAALRLFGYLLPDSLRRRLRKALRRIRRAAAAARCDDVHAAMLSQANGHGHPAAAEAREFALRTIQRSRARARRAVRAAAKRQGRLLRLRQAVVRALADPQPLGVSMRPARADRDAAPYTLAELAVTRLVPWIDAVRTVPVAELEDVARLHGLRIAGKRLRYAVEILAGCFPAEFRSELYPRITALQERLGEINDLAELADRLEALAARAAAKLPDGQDAREAKGQVPAALADWAGALRAQLEERRRAFLEWWASPDSRAVFSELVWLVETHCAAATAATEARAEVPEGNAPTGAAAAVERRRVAAIDVGTNSIRLVVAETDPLTGWRIIDDVKETTRLGEGLYATGQLGQGAVARSLAALERMRAIADGYQVQRLRAVGTSAVREARNGQEFIELAQQRAGVSIEVIDAEREARLAFSSVASAFDLGEGSTAVVDLGGGSAELVLSCGGLIDAIYKLPLGAVRLTELYGSRDGAGEYRYEEMRQAVDRIIADTLVDAPPVELLIGTGGTFTSLARVSIRRGTHSRKEGRFPFALRGYELLQAEVTELLEMLRRMPLSQRRRVPGLSARRAEIIVAGVCVVRRLMEHLKADRLRVHDGGIRDGLLMEMLEEPGSVDVGRPAGAREALRSVREFARRMGYERAHSEHVMRLATRIFDQLAGQLPDPGRAWSTPQCRELLRAAALLHDVGVCLRFRQHHKHSYDMIRHARLAGWSRRQIELIANIARYHRRASPQPGHANFGLLSEEDRRRVAHLAGILRIADGLDRLHTQNVVDVVARADEGCVRLEARSTGDARVNLRYAARKSDLFESAFGLRVALVWSAAGRAALSWKVR